MSGGILNRAQYPSGVIALALSRRIALNLLRADTTSRISIKGKRENAAWNDALMERLLKG